MCQPEAILVMTGGLSMDSYMQGRQADEVADAESDRHQQEVKRANRDANIQQNMLSQQALEESFALQQDRQALALESLRSVADLRTAGAESGLGGVSSIRSFVASNINATTQAGVQNTNEANSALRFGVENTGIRNNRRDRLKASRTRVENAIGNIPGAVDHGLSAFNKAVTLAPMAISGG